MTDREISVTRIYIAWVALAIGWSAHPVTTEGLETMEALALVVDGEEVVLSQSPRREPPGARVLVPVRAFSEALGAEVKEMDGNGSLAVCKADLCIPLSEEETLSLDGEVFAYLSAFGEELGLQWQLSDSTLRVATGGRVVTGLAVGSRPPIIELPDLHTGVPVSSADYVGKKTVFYVWASW